MRFLKQGVGGVRETVSRIYVDLGQIHPCTAETPTPKKGGGRGSIAPQHSYPHIHRIFTAYPQVIHRVIHSATQHRIKSIRVRHAALRAPRQFGAAAHRQWSCRLYIIYLTRHVRLRYARNCLIALD